MSLSSALVGHPFGDASHQHVVVDSIEEFFQIDIDHASRSLRRRTLAPGPPPDGPSVPGGSRSCARRTSGPSALAEPAAPPAGSGGRRRRGCRAFAPRRPAWGFRPASPAAAGRFRRAAVPECLASAHAGSPRHVVDGHPIDAGSSLVGPDSFPRHFEILSLAHLLHQDRSVLPGFRASRFAMGGSVPSSVGDRGFHPDPPSGRPDAMLVLGFLPLSAHELRVLLATPNRSGLRPSFPAGDPLLRLSARVSHSSVADSTCLLCPLLTSAPRSGRLAAPSVPSSGHGADLPR